MAYQKITLEVVVRKDGHEVHVKALNDAMDKIKKQMRGIFSSEIKTEDTGEPENAAEVAAAELDERINLALKYSYENGLALTILGTENVILHNSVVNEGIQTWFVPIDVGLAEFEASEWPAKLERARASFYKKKQM